MPVLKHDMGNCHVYVDRGADLEMAARILINAKCQRPGVCNAAESLLVHGDVAHDFLPQAARCCASTRSRCAAASAPACCFPRPSRRRKPTMRRNTWTWFYR